jgi:predicted DCC family thiol-disulfide oxidoreductase YuxK
VTDAAGRLLVLYDGECGFCAWGLAWLLRWDRAGLLRPASIQGEEGERVLAGMPAQARLSSWHVLDERGRLRSGGAALATVLELLPGGGVLAALARAQPRATELGYRWVADHRTSLSRVVSSAAKRRARALIAARMH